METFLKRKPTSIDRDYYYHSSSILVLFLLLSPLIIIVIRAVSANGEHYENNGDGEHKRESGKEDGAKKGRLPVENAIGMSMSLSSRWDALKTWAKLTLMGIRPPHIKYGKCGSSAGQVVKKAASRSFETSQETVKQSVESAVTAAEEAVHKTREKIKMTVSSQVEDLDAEL